jgi:ABC-type bacteriocin/lantibiotic exporter with double-glycine peptidase domain
MKIKRVDVLKKTYKFIFNSKGSVILLIISSLLVIPVSLISPYLFSILIDKVMLGRQIDQLKIVVLGLLMVFVIRLILDFINLYCSNRILNKFTYSIRQKIWNKYLHISYNEYEKKDTGDLKMRLFDDVDCLGNFLKDQVVDYITNILLVAVNLIVVMYINYKLALLSLIIIPFVFLINHFIGSGTKKVNEEIRVVNENYYTFEHNTFQFWKEIKAQNVENEFIGKFKNYRTVLAKLGMRWIRFWVYGEIFSDFKANYLTQVFIYILGAFFILSGQLTVGILIAFSQYYAALFTSLDTINQKNVSLKVNTPYYKRIFETLSLEVEDDKEKIKPNLDGNIQVSDVSFKYEQSVSNVLGDINLKIQKGDYVAVVGKSGCGKTTLIKLLLNMYKPQNGYIKIDDFNVTNILKKHLYKNIGECLHLDRFVI